VAVGNLDFYCATRMHITPTMRSQCLSVCMPVTHSPVFCRNGYIYPRTFSLSGSYRQF